MDLSDLRVLHRPKRKSSAGVDACCGAPDGSDDAHLVRDTADDAAGFVLDTCQRRIVVTSAAIDDARPAEGEWLEGAAAYRFLLELAAGLKSSLVGECEIVSQLKSAWGEHEAHGGALVTALRPWIQVVLADAKEVREHYLRGTGGQSYGSLLRNALGQTAGGPVLVLGAGKLASGVLPYLHADVIRLWNRTLSTAQALREHLQPRMQVPIEVLAPTAEAELAAWAEASLVVLCVPADAARDGERVAAALRREPPARPRVAHLGILEAGDTAWSAIPEPITLETLFALDRRQAALRAERLALANRWCDSRTRLRALDRCVSIAHGWEDLAGFAVAGAA
jgi:hypothetical protein